MKSNHVWGVVDKETGAVLAVRFHRAAARQAKGPNSSVKKFILVEVAK